MENNFFHILILLGGFLFLFLGLAPILSRKYFDEAYKKIWKGKREFLSEEDSYIYSRYIRQLFPILMGVTLVGYALYKMLF